MKAVLKKLTLLSLVAVLFLTGCSTGDTTWVYDSGGTRIPAGLYITFLMESLSELETREYERNADNMDYTTPTTKKLLKTDVDGVPADQWVRDNAALLSRKYFWAEQKFDALGLEFSADAESSVQGMVDSMWPLYSEYYESNGVGRSSIEAYQRNITKQNLIFENMYAPGGERAVTDEELMERYDQDYALSDYLFVYKATGESEDGKSVEEQDAQAMERLEGYRDRLAAGDVSFEELIFEEESFLNIDNPDADITMPEKGAYTITVNRESGQYYGEDFVNGIFDSQVGTPNIVEADGYYILINRYDILEDPSYFEASRATVLFAAKSDEFLDLIEQEAESISMTSNQDALNLYTPSKIKDMQ